MKPTPDQWQRLYEKYQADLLEQAQRIAELRGIVADLARCEVSEWDYTHPIHCPDDVDQWELIERAQRATQEGGEG